MEQIRNSAKAIIIAADKLLVIGMRDDDGPWYLLPGGGQKRGESLVDALRRECAEEIAIVPTVGRLRFVRDYIGRNHEFAATDSETHQVEFMFTCQVPSDYVPTAGHEPDSKQVEVRWIPLANLMSYRLYPLSLRPLLMQGDTSRQPIYLGDVN